MRSTTNGQRACSRLHEGKFDVGAGMSSEDNRHQDAGGCRTIAKRVKFSPNHAGTLHFPHHQRATLVVWELEPVIRPMSDFERTNYGRSSTDYLHQARRKSERDS